MATGDDDMMIIESDFFRSRISALNDVMNRNALITKARKVLEEAQKDTQPLPWLQLPGGEPPPDDFKGVYLKFNVLPDIVRTGNESKVDDQSNRL